MVALLFVACLLELDPGNLRRGEVGTLPRSTARHFYEIANVLDDDLLICVMEVEQNGQAAAPTARFFLKDRDLVAKYLPEARKNKGNLALGIVIALPGEYEVIGTKTSLAGTLSRLAKKK